MASNDGAPAAARSTGERRATRLHGQPDLRKRIEEHFGWGKTIGRIRQTVYRGLERVDQHFKLTMTASNIVRMARICARCRKERHDEPRKPACHARSTRRDGYVRAISDCCLNVLDRFASAVSFSSVGRFSTAC